MKRARWPAVLCRRIIMKRMIMAVLVLAAAAASAGAADMPRRLTYQGPGIHDWSGLYLGVHGGVLMGSSSMRTGIPGVFDLYDSASTSGFVGGGQIGYLLQSGAIVYGLELSGSLTSADLKSTDGFAITKQLKHPWEAALVGRLGYAFDRTLVSVYGGAARGKFTVSEDVFGFGEESASSSRWAPRVGARIDFAMTRNWSAGLSVDYTKWGNFDHANNTLGVVSTYNFNEARVKADLNYRF